MILPIKYQALVLKMFHDCQGHQGMERTIALCRECCYWNTMYKDETEDMNNCPHCQVAKGHYVGPKTKPHSIIANEPFNLLCAEFAKWTLQDTVRKMYLS